MLIVVKIMDGLGNQMFQYAFARYLQEVYHEQIVFETMRYGKNCVRPFGLTGLCIDSSSQKNYRVASKLENRLLRDYSKFMRLILEKSMGISRTGDEAYKKMIRWGFYTTDDPIAYHPFEKTSLPIKFVRGYFQSEKYFSGISEHLLSELRVKGEPDDEQKKIIETMHKSNSVAVHIRRGDYIGNGRFDVCTENYYVRAIEKIKRLVEEPHFFIFSNSLTDLAWIREHYAFPCSQISFVSAGKDEFDDLRFMYNCQHHIISNSTFSWWGAYLSTQLPGITIAPERWYNDLESYEDIYLPSWLRISPD